MVPGGRAKPTRLPFLFTEKGLREAGSTTVYSDGQGGVSSAAPTTYRSSRSQSGQAPHTLSCTLADVFLTVSTTPILARTETRRSPLNAPKPLLLRQLMTGMEQSKSQEY